MKYAQLNIPVGLFRVFSHLNPFIWPICRKIQQNGVQFSFFMYLRFCGKTKAIEHIYRGFNEYT